MPPPRYRWRAGLLLAGLLASHPAGAVFTFVTDVTPRLIQLQVGSPGGTINNVTFNVTGVHTSPSPQPVPGIPDTATPATSPAGGVRVRMLARWNNSNNPNLRLTVNSAVGLACVAGTGCASTTIPFNTISWVAHEKGSFQGFDIQNGAFTGSSEQILASFNCCAANLTVGNGQVEMVNTLVFTYSNATLYPAGRYTGRVVFTAILQ